MSVYKLKNQLVKSSSENKKLKNMYNQQKMKLGENSELLNKISNLESELTKSRKEINIWRDRYNHLKENNDPVVFDDLLESKQFYFEKGKTKNKSENNSQLKRLLESQKNEISSLRTNLTDAHNQLNEQNKLILSLRDENNNCINNIENIKREMFEKIETLKLTQTSDETNGEEMKKLQESMMKLANELKTLRDENKLLIDDKKKWIEDFKNEMNIIKDQKTVVPKIINQEVIIPIILAKQNII